MIKEIKYKNKIIATIYKKTEKERGINFLTNQKDNLQVGILNHPKNHIIQSHIHNPIKRIITGTNEILYVEKGRMKVILYNKIKEKIATVILQKGDLINLVSAGHGFKFLKDSRIIYLKQGPYVNKEIDKKIL